tara:strand:- start:2809 stop:3450 length:642 start_codon:yes stop_codon:yes gene_type:complete
MMKKNSNKGFALVLSLVLLLAMSLMGGGLIVIASSDHQGNNSSDEYQQTFYVAETALMQAEKSIIDKVMGQINNSGERGDRFIPRNGDSDGDGNATDPAPTQTACFKSFRNLSRDSDFRVFEHIQDQSFLTLIRPLVQGNTDEEKKLEKYKYEFFSVNAGSSNFKAAGSSVSKTSLTTQRLGTTYRIYGCGMKGNVSNPEILIPLETTLIISN